MKKKLSRNKNNTTRSTQYYTYLTTVGTLARIIEHNILLLLCIARDTISIIFKRLFKSPQFNCCINDL